MTRAHSERPSGPEIGGADVEQDTVVEPVGNELDTADVHAFEAVEP